MNMYGDVKDARVRGDRIAVRVRIDWRDMNIRRSVRVMIVRGKLNMWMIVEMNGNTIIVVSVEFGATVIW